MHTHAHSTDTKEKKSKIKQQSCHYTNKSVGNEGEWNSWKIGTLTLSAFLGCVCVCTTVQGKREHEAAFYLEMFACEEYSISVLNDS